MGGIVIKPVLLMIGLSVVIMAFGSAVLAMDGSKDWVETNGWSIEVKKTSISQPAPAPVVQEYALGRTRG